MAKKRVKNSGIDSSLQRLRAHGRELVSELLKHEKAANSDDEEARLHAVQKVTTIKAELLELNAEIRAKALPAPRTVTIVCPSCHAQLAPSASEKLALHYRPGTDELCERSLRKFKGGAPSRSSSVRTVSGGLPGSGRKA